MTIREIADSLGVSPTSVSIVLNNKPGVRKELRDKITELLIQNGYTIKEKATQKKEADQIISYTKKTILFLYYTEVGYLHLRNNDILTTYLNEIERICREHDCNLIVKNVTGNNLNDTLQNTNDIDGIVLLGIELTPSFNIDRTACNKPLIILDGYFPGALIDSVNVDNYIGLYKIIEYLYEKGHRRIGHIKNANAYGTLPDRWRCFYECIDHFGMEITEDNILHVRINPPELQEDVSNYLKTAQNPPTVFFADNDYIAVSTIIAMQQSGYNVPNDFSVVGFDNVDLSTILKPNLTTVTMDFRGMAKHAFYRLMQLINDGDGPIIKSTIAPRFIERESVKDLTK